MVKCDGIFGWLLAIILLSGCQQQLQHFEQIDASRSGLDFINEIIEDDSLNILESEFVYNGAGVAIGDLNGDGLDDLFFAGNQVKNRLYLNHGQLRFEDVTEFASISKPDEQFWSSGVNIVDINLDGRQDIYICNTLRKEAAFRRNLLYINQGNDGENRPMFEEMGQEYGIADTSHSSHAQFFDYDNDGDLDLFVGVNLIEAKYPNAFIPIVEDGSSANRDNLFQNNWSDSLGHPIFHDVTIEAGILQDGYSHSTLVNDFNEDGWLDIYVANDYESNDLIFINNQDGTFTNRAGDIFKHFSLSAMGSDVGDINNDGNLDFVTSEMQPYYNKRKKLFQGESSYQREILTRRFGYEYQYTRNTLQLNMGNDPESGLPVYGDIGIFAGVQETDWSWATLFADYDNDSYQDLFIANGFPKDVTDRDFSDFRALAAHLVSKEELFAAIPEVKSPNFMFKNNGDLSFSDVTEKWGLNVSSFSNGAAYGDLDQDGDLDLIINNIDDPVLLFENHLNELTSNHYLRIKLKGPEGNPDAFGSAVEIFHQNGRQKIYLLSNRGYLSKSESFVHFGLGDLEKVDSIIVYWPGGSMQKAEAVAADQVLEISYQNATNRKQLSTNTGLFREVSQDHNLDFVHKEIDYVDYNFQRTLPHKFSQYGPALAVGDINGDNLDDIFISGSRSYPETWLTQNGDHSFIARDVNYKQSEALHEEDAGTLLFDADQDGDLDLYIARGGAQEEPKNSLYQDVILVNDGEGNFTLAEDALPPLNANGSSVKAADFDRDGDLDLFVGSRVLPRAFPKSDRSYLLRNDSENGRLKFVDVSAESGADLTSPGMISDALWTDYNGDFWPDLLLACEWMPLRLFENQEGRFKEVTAETGLDQYHGWWTALAPADLDNDGDMDYIAGNYGENIYFKCSSGEPMRVYGQDLDNNGSIDPLISCFWRDSVGDRYEYLYHPRQDVIKQFVGIRKRFNTYAEFGESTVPEMFAGGEMDDALILKTNWLKSSWIENQNGKFVVHPLPIEAQLAPIYGIQTLDYDHDGRLDIVMVGNDFGMEVQQGRADAFVGLVLHNAGAQFEPLRLAESKWYVPGDAKSLAKVMVSDSAYLLISGQNSDELKALVSLEAQNLLIRVDPQIVKCSLKLTDGSSRLHEFYWGDTFQSQSSRILASNPSIKEITWLDQNGEEVNLVQ